MISADAEPPVYLSKTEKLIWNIVRRFPGVGIDRLVDLLYGDDQNGGPDCAINTVRTQICQLNKRLRQVGQSISGRRNGRYDGYRLYQD